MTGVVNRSMGFGCVIDRDAGWTLRRIRILVVSCFLAMLSKEGRERTDIDHRSSNHLQPRSAKNKCGPWGLGVGMRILNNGDPIKYNDNNEKTWLFLMIYTRDRPTLTLFSSQLSTLSYSCEIYMKSKNKIYLCTFICINLIYPI